MAIRLWAKIRQVASRPGNLRVFGFVRPNIKMNQSPMPMHKAIRFAQRIRRVANRRAATALLVVDLEL